MKTLNTSQKSGKSRRARSSVLKTAHTGKPSRKGCVKPKHRTFSLWTRMASILGRQPWDSSVHSKSSEPIFLSVNVERQGPYFVILDLLCLMFLPVFVAGVGLLISTAASVYSNEILLWATNPFSATSLATLPVLQCLS